VTVATEHKAVLEPCLALEAQGWQVTALPVTATGLVDLAAVERAVTPGTALVSVMLANNEIGVVQPLAEIARLAHAHGAMVHSDAVQALGKLPMDVAALDVDLASFSAHKVYGPKGVGALYVKRGADKRLRAQVRGGGQERGLRGGTSNVPGIVGFGAACEVAGKDLPAEMARLNELRDRLWLLLRNRLGGVTLNGAATPRLAGNLNVSFDGIDGETLMLAITDVAVSSGAACTSAEPSHVLMALGLETRRALASLRFGLGRETTGEDIVRAAEHIGAVVSQLRAQAPRQALAGAGPGGRA
jgi:cysteine desulfurase